MNEPKFKLRYWITYLFKNLEVQNTFKPGLLHMTVIPWFVTEHEDKEAIDAFETNFSGQKAFAITVGEAAHFKHKQRIPINLVQPKPELSHNHQLALELFEELESRWGVRTPHVGAEYTPHIRRRPGKSYKKGDELKIDAVYLIGANRREDGLRTVATKVRLT